MAWTQVSGQLPIAGWTEDPKQCKAWVQPILGYDDQYVKDIIGSTTYSSNHPPYMSMDGDESTYYDPSSNNSYLYYDAQKQINVNSVRMKIEAYEVDGEVGCTYRFSVMGGNITKSSNVSDYTEIGYCYVEQKEEGEVSTISIDCLTQENYRYYLFVISPPNSISNPAYKIYDIQMGATGEGITTPVIWDTLYWQQVDGELPYRPRRWAEDPPDSGVVLTTVWVSDNKSIPTKKCFPSLKKIEGYPESCWRSNEVDVPYKTVFPNLFKINDTPASVWVSDGEKVPYKTLFPRLLKFTGAPNALWVIDDDDLTPRKIFFPRLYVPMKETKPRYVVSKIKVKKEPMMNIVETMIIHNIKVRKE